MAERDLYIAIMHAAARGRGLHLSAAEVGQLAFDDAIATHAANCLAEDEWDRTPIKSAQGKESWTGKPKPWAQINPYRKRKAANAFARAYAE